jgi:hypothetical protein
MTTNAADRAGLVDAVRRHALDHYERDGWDILTECWSDAEIDTAIGDAATVEDAIAAVRDHLAPIVEHRDEIRSTAF